MIIEKKQEGGHTILAVEGVIKLGQSAQFFAEALKKALSEGEGNVLLDLSAINYIDSTGIGELVGYMVRLQEQQRKLILVRPPDRIRKLLTVANVLDLFGVFDSAEAALAANAS